MSKVTVAERTINDFGDQWTRFVSNDGFYGSKELFADIVGPAIGLDELVGKKVLDVGSGTGRIVSMLIAAGADHVTAVEPSDAFYALEKNVALIRHQTDQDVLCLRVAGDQMNLPYSYDVAFSIGVLHHIPDPDPVMRKVHAALVPGGKFVVWLYGKEGNGLYLFIIEPLRKLTQYLPHPVLMGIVWVLYPILLLYRQVCRLVKLPLSDYIVNVLFRMAPEKRRLVIYDQLNPAYAKYYTENEAADLMRRAGFSGVSVLSRRGYSWIAVGEKS
jgi:SAM-dependent methyltransferase